MNKKDLSIYIHIPFCIKKCDYCDFLSGPGSSEEQAYYVRVLQKEIRSFQAISTLYKVRTIFFGGGTPSCIDERHISRILEQLRETFDIAPDAEITIECNPGTITADKLKCYRENGINRLSIGLQSAVDAELEMLGRIHNYQQFVQNYSLARRLGFDNINIDLMSGVPGQTFESWENTLIKVCELEPDHISAYSLIIEPGTPFYNRYGTPEGRKLLPSDELDRKMYHHTKEYLATNGYKQYEFSNYAMEQKQCKHNIVYWTMGEYLGFGLGASSFLQGKRFSNPNNMASYNDFAKNAYKDFGQLKEQPQKNSMEEFMFLGLRMTDGISIEEFEQHFQCTFEEIYGKIIRKLIDKELIKKEDDRVYLTDLGVDVSNQVLAEFLL